MKTSKYFSIRIFYRVVLISLLLGILAATIIKICKSYYFKQYTSARVVFCNEKSRYLGISQPVFVVRNGSLSSDTHTYKLHERLVILDSINQEQILVAIGTSKNYNERKFGIISADMVSTLKEINPPLPSMF
ncbi:MAG: hypothetical protein RL660_2675 [Bacteroidota bacterium]|jgi:hypothetical protein